MLTGATAMAIIMAQANNRVSTVHRTVQPTKGIYVPRSGKPTLQCLFSIGATDTQCQSYLSHVHTDMFVLSRQELAYALILTVPNSADTSLLYVCQQLKQHTTNDTEPLTLQTSTAACGKPITLSQKSSADGNCVPA